MSPFNPEPSSLFIIAGPCVLESLDLGLQVAEKLADCSQRLNVPVVFKSSFDKANRSSLDSFRGPGLETGLSWLEKIKADSGLLVTTDIHLPIQADPVAQVADVLQIPAFLSRQTDLLVAAARTQKTVNVKKGQFLAPWDMAGPVDKIRSTGNSSVWLTERGSSFGYNNLVVDYRSVPEMHKLEAKVVFDATHSVQLPGGQGTASGGNREFVPVLARAAVAAGCDGVFLEVHPDPDCALCDGPNSWPLDRTYPLLEHLVALAEVAYVC